jgi:hypothetical protein
MKISQRAFRDTIVDLQTVPECGFNGKEMLGQLPEPES